MALRTETIKFRTALVGLGVAIVGAVALVLPARQAASTANDKAATASSAAATSKAQVTDLAQQNITLQSQLASAQATITALQTQPTDSPTATGNVAVWHRGPLGLKDGQYADLDAPDSDPQWGKLSDSPSPGTPFDIQWDSAGLGFPTWGMNAQAAIVPNSGTDDSACATTQLYAHDSIPLVKIKQGTSICVTTGDGRFSLLTVTSVASTGSSVSFDVKTYKKEGD